MIPQGTSALFPFQVNSLGNVSVSVGEISGDGEPLVQVYAPDGSFVGQTSNSSSNGGTFQFLAEQTGSYKALVLDLGSDEATEFRIRAVSTGDTAQLIPGRDKALLNGEESEAMIPQGTSALFPFQVNSLGNVSVSVGEISGDGEPLVQVYAPDGSFVGQTSTGSSNGGTFQFLAEQTGPYKALVLDVGSNEATEFRVRVVSTGDTAQMIPGRDKALLNGEEFEAFLPQGTTAVFPFQVNSLGNVSVSVGEISGEGEPLVQVFDPNGSFVGQTSTGSSNGGTFQFVADQTGPYKALVLDVGSNEATEFRITAFGIAQTAGQYIFYNNSSFDSANDSAAIATDKVALLPGKTATFENYTSYIHGINGIAVDLFNPTSLIASDFQFKFGNGDDVDTFVILDSNTTITNLTTVAGAGVNGSDRVFIEFADGAITNGWLQVTVLGKRLYRTDQR